MGLKRYLGPMFIALLAGAALLVVPSGPTPVRQDLRRDSLYQLRVRMRHAFELWAATDAKALARRILDSSRAAPAEEPIRLVGFPAGLRAATPQAVFASLRKQIETPTADYRVELLVYDRYRYSATRSLGISYSGALVSGRGCVAITDGYVNRDDRIEVYRPSLEQALAPCLLHAAFGQPGREIGKWLLATRYGAAGSNEWLRRPNSDAYGRGETPWATWHYPEMDSFDPIDSPMFWFLGATLGGNTMRAYSMGGPALRCLTGNLELCRRSALEPAVVFEGAPDSLAWVPDQFIARGGLLMPHQIGEWLLSDLIREEGREKFARFWSSDSPVAEAFHDAFGRELGAWVRAWAQRKWESGGLHSGEAAGPVLLGASLRIEWLPLALFWSALALVIVSLAATRREVT